ncbi:hypothetical protein ACGFYP_33745 [Streptomyces sp. NPDC048370]|uniref:hypothetical protein n=1 Tax=Streptomyces sp. NPDC048370 TaxID=3365540 RepID=UPI003719A06E
MDEHHQLGRWDAAVDVLVNWIGWLLALVFVVGCFPGWCWGGDLNNLPLMDETVAQAAAEHRCWTEVPQLLLTCGALLVWCAAADRVRGIDPRLRNLRQLRFPSSKAGW